MPQSRQNPPLYVDDWGSWLRAGEGKADRTVETYRERVVLFLEDQKIDDPATITFKAVEAHVKRLYAAGRAESTRGLTVSAVRSFCGYLVALDVLDHNPTRNVKAPTPYRKEKGVLTREEIKRLIWDGREGRVPVSPIEHRNRIILWCMYALGLRSGEIPPLRRDQIEWTEARGRIVAGVLVRKAKGSRGDVRLYLDDLGSRVLADYLHPGRSREQIAADSPFIFPASHGGMLSDSSMWRIFTERVKAAKIKPKGRKISPHILRHSIATHLLEDGLDVDQVRDHLRHANISTTSIYLHSAQAGDRATRLIDHHPMRPKKKDSTGDVRKAMDALLSDLSS